MVFFWWLYLVSGVTALRYLNVPMYSTLRRMTTLIVALGEIAMFGTKYSRSASVRAAAADAAVAAAAWILFWMNSGGTGVCEGESGWVVLMVVGGPHSCVTNQTCTFT